MNQGEPVIIESQEVVQSNFLAEHELSKRLALNPLDYILEFHHATSSTS